VSVIDKIIDKINISIIVKKYKSGGTAIKRVTVKGVCEYLKSKDKNIGTYSNFNKVYQEKIE